MYIYHISCIGQASSKNLKALEHNIRNKHKKQEVTIMEKINEIK